jgi:hypothetical protein
MFSEMTVSYVMRTGSKLAQLILDVKEEILKMETYLNKEVNATESGVTLFKRV